MYWQLALIYFDDLCVHFGLEVNDEVLLPHLFNSICVIAFQGSQTYYDLNELFICTYIMFQNV